MSQQKQRERTSDGWVIFEASYYPGECYICGAKWKKGEPMEYNPNENDPKKKVRCLKKHRPEEEKKHVETAPTATPTPTVSTGETVTVTFDRQQLIDLRKLIGNGIQSLEAAGEAIKEMMEKTE